MDPLVSAVNAPTNELFTVSNVVVPSPAAAAPPIKLF